MYPYPEGSDQNAQPVPFSDILALPHAYSVLAQIESPDGKVLAWGISVTGGSVTVDRGAAYRRSVQLQVKGYSGSGFVDVFGDSGLTEKQTAELLSTLIPDSPGDALSPYGNLIRLWYGVAIPGFVNPYLGDDHYRWGLGVFRLAAAEVSGDEVPILSLVGYDHSRAISRNKLTQPWIVAAGQNYGDAIVALAADRLPNLRYRGHAVAAVSPQIIVDPQEDPWSVITEWAAAFGHEAYFDNEGYLVIQPEPDPAFRPLDWTYGDGTVLSNAMVLGVDRSMSDEPGHNGVILTSESTTLPAPIRSEAWDMNPSSPTYALGPYGRVPKFVSNPYVATQEQADAAARAELLRSIGGTERLELNVMPNPAHEAGDIIRVVRPLSRTDQVAIIESFEIPLGPEAMRVSCRERRSLS